MNIFNYVSIAGLISFIIAFFNKEHDKYNRNRERYFDCFLVKFYNSYRKNNNINLRKFYIKSFDYIDIYIPAYVNYLVEKKEYDKLKKVLLVDYYDFFPNTKNAIVQALLNLSNVFDFLYYLLILLILMILMAGLIIILGIMGIVYKAINIFEIEVLTSAFGLLLLLFICLKYFFYSYDMYTSSEKSIKKLINKKLDKFENLKEEIYYFK